MWSLLNILNLFICHSVYHDSQYIHLITSLGFEIHEETSWSLAMELSIFLEGILPPSLFLLVILIVPMSWHPRSWTRQQMRAYWWEERFKLFPADFGRPSYFLKALGFRQCCPWVVLPEAQLNSFDQMFLSGIISNYADNSIRKVPLGFWPLHALTEQPQLECFDLRKILTILVLITNLGDLRA